MMKFGIVIPAYNSEKTLKDVIKRIPKKYKNFIIIVVDDGSKDRTCEIAKSCKVKIIRHKKNKGYGAAQKTGFSEALKDGCDAVILLHSDGQYAPEEIPKLIKPILEKRADIVLGSRALEARC